jgi:Spy/CpxP family protein refolding chaperone
MKHIVTLLVLAISIIAQAAPPPPPPGGGKGKGKGGPGGESAEMQALLKSFNLTSEQQAKYDAAKKQTGEDMRKIHEGKLNATLSMDEVLKQALASHKAFNTAVKEILTPEQYAKWEPLRESDHHKIAQSHKDREDAESKANMDKRKSASDPKK